MSTCNACNGHLEELLDLGLQPIVNKLLNRADEPAHLHPMRVGGCAKCGLVQLIEPVDPIEFYTDYATPSSWKHEPHVGNLLSYLERVVPRDAKILEIGCNDGRFLQRLKERGWSNLSGLEPTGNTSKEAAGKGFKVYHQSLDSNTSLALVDDQGAWDCVVLRQVLEHISELQDFGRALNGLLRKEGLLVVEVPDSRINFGSLDYALWEEHVNCFTPESLGRFLTQHGFHIIHSYTSVFSGVCLTVIAEKIGGSNDSGLSNSWDNQEALQAEVSMFREWSRKFPDFRMSVHEEIQRFAEKGDVVLYGVGSRSSTFINILGLSSLISYAVDDQTEKQQKFMPQSKLPIHPSNEMTKRQSHPMLVLLGVNAENEESILQRSELSRRVQHNSVLPPSSRLLNAWQQNLER